MGRELYRVPHYRADAYLLAGGCGGSGRRALDHDGAPVRAAQRIEWRYRDRVTHGDLAGWRNDDGGGGRQNPARVGSDCAASRIEVRRAISEKAIVVLIDAYALRL